MRINGYWRLGDDGTVRPFLEGAVQAADGSWVAAQFLVDTGADCSAVDAVTLAKLGLSMTATDGVAGVGGQATAVAIDTVVQLTQEGGTPVLFRGRFVAFTALESLETSVLGRDILNLFAVIVDRPRDLVCLLGQRHEYAIVER